MKSSKVDVCYLVSDSFLEKRQVSQGSVWFIGSFVHVLQPTLSPENMDLSLHQSEQWFAYEWKNYLLYMLCTVLSTRLLHNIISICFLFFLSGFSYYQNRTFMSK